MQHSKTIFVTGATGNQGGAVIKSLINNGYKIKALTRNASSERAQKLKHPAIEIIEGDLDEPRDFGDHLQNIDGIFCVLTFENGIDKEIKRGILLTNLAKDSDVKHIVYSSVAGVDLQTGIPHFESKYIVEKHLRQMNLPFTIIRPVSLYENFLIPQVKKMIDKGKLPSAINKSVPQQFISAKDIGEITVAVFNNTAEYTGVIITPAAEELTLQQVADIFTESTGKKISFQKMPLFLARLLMGKDLYTMFRWVNENGGTFIKDVEAYRADHPGLLRLKDWIQIHFK